MIYLVAALMVAIILIGTFFNVERDDEFIKGIIMFTLTIQLVIISFYAFEKETAINCLQGNNPYEMEIKKTYQNDSLIKVDTVYKTK